jgi:ketosteroid isomerase-like protein
VAARRYNSKKDFLSNVIRPFNSRMSTPLRPSVRDLFADGDRVVVVFDAEGAARDGIPYRNTYAWLMELRGERIVEVTAFFDSLAFNDLWQRVTPA